MRLQGDHQFVATYVYMMPEPRPFVARTIQVDVGLLIDVDDEGRVIGIETIGPGSIDWYGILRHPGCRFVAEAS